jgi:hypothetical protein
MTIGPGSKNLRTPSTGKLFLEYDFMVSSLFECMTSLAEHRQSLHQILLYQYATRLKTVPAVEDMFQGTGMLLFYSGGFRLYRLALV